MPFIKFTEQEKETANLTDIATYLSSRGEKIKKSGREYVWEAPSGKVSIRQNQWYSQYERIGGGAISFVQKFYGLSYPEAVRNLLGSDTGTEIVRTSKEPSPTEKKPFIPPEKHTDMRRAYAYLAQERKIDREVLNAFIAQGLIYEDAKNHNVVFVGIDPNGNIRHAQKRSTNNQSDFKGNVNGSDANYSFHYTGKSDFLFVFEAPIDMLAFISLHKNNWQNHSYVALCSIADRAAIQMLKDNPNIKTVYLCLDHDSAGIEGCYRISESIHTLGEYTVLRKSPKNKDWDEDLKKCYGIIPIPSSEHLKLEYIREICDVLKELSVCETEEYGAFLRHRGDLIEDTLAKIRRIPRGSLNDIKASVELAKTCLLFCYLRDCQHGEGKTFSFYVSAMKRLYKPHQDKETAKTLREYLDRELLQIDKEMNFKTAASETEVIKQNERMLKFALDCLRYGGALIYEQQKQSELAMAV